MRALLATLLVLLLGLAGASHAALSAGPQSPTAASGTSWTNPGGALVSDDSYATYAGTAQDTLVLTGFGFTIPADADIRGIVISVEGFVNDASAVNRQIRLALTKNGSVVVGTAKTGVELAAVEGIVSAGTPTDRWGVSWTPAEINAGTFGVLLADNDTTATNPVTIDHVKITVEYGSMLHNSVTTSSTKWSSAGGWGVSAGKYGAFVCATCHAKNTGNIKRIRTTLVAPNGVDQFPIETAAGSIAFQDVREGTSDFGNDGRLDKTQSSNICEGCHTYDVTGVNGVGFHAYDMSGPGDPGHYNESNCMACHPHSQGFKAAGCDSCHGNPPTVSTLGGPNGLADSPFATASATAGAHQTHALTLGYGCGNCHSGYVMPQESTAFPGQGDISISFSNFGATSGSYTGQVGVSYNDVAGTGGTSCASVYCHGGSIGGSAVSWTGTVACGDCHKATAAQMAGTAPGSHAQHAGNNAGQLNLACTKCHTNPGAAGHVSGTVSWALDTADGKFGATATYRSAASGVTAERAPSAIYGQCSNIYCHSPGQNSSGGALSGGDYVNVTWGGTANCGSCHGASGIASGSHAAHIADAGVTGCNACHTDAAADASSYNSASHVNQLIDVMAGLTYTAGGTPGNGYGTCAASCHDTGRNSSGLTSAWGTPLDNCSECHATLPATGSHASHVGVNFGGSAIACAACHAGTSEGTTAGAGHRDGNIDVSSGGYPADKVLGSAFASCSTATCHQSGTLPNDYVVTSVWGTDDVACTSCHAAEPATGSHTKHIATTGNCSACHTDAVINVSYNSAQHGDLNIDVAVGGYTANKIYNSAYLSCSALACHSDGMAATGDSPVWGDAGAGCAACHLSDMATGSHTIHLADGASCGDCHGDAVKDSTAPTGVHANNNVDVYNSAVGDLGYPQVAAYGIASWSTCTAASCHDDGTGTPAVTPSWGTANNDCSACHATIPATGSHDRHVTSTAYAKAVCADCHNGAVQASNAGTAHRDGNLDVLNGYPLVVAKGGAPYDTCTTAYCHSSGQSLSDGASAVPTYATVTWGGSAACGSCHAVAGLTSGSHAAHLGAPGVSGCGDCHADAANDASVYNSVVHVDGAINVTGTYNAAGLPGNGYGSCSTAACHDNGTGDLAVTPTWGQANNDCSACHATIPDSGSHVKHVTTQAISAAIGCGDCHGTAVQGTTAPADHLDGNLDVYNSVALDLGYPANVAKGGAPYDSCSTAYCHSNGKGTYQSVTWGATLTGCASCHGNPPAGAHPSNPDCQACHTNVNVTNNGFVDVNLHIDGIVQAEGGENCMDCHGTGAYKDPNAVHSDHAKHTDVDYFLAGKTLSASDYGKLAASGTNSIGWYDVQYGAAGTLIAGCGQCHPSNVSFHLNSANNVDVAQNLTPAAPNAKRNNAVAASYSAGQCSNIYCHSDGVVDYLYPNTPTWNTGGPLGCNGCHGNAPATGAHDLHAVGIHYTTLYDSDLSGLMAPAAAPGVNAGAAHGNSATASVISCLSCHADTVASSVNAGSTVCGSCHTAGDGKVGSSNASIKANSTTHLDGAKSVSFSVASFKAKAQLRDDITTVPELNNSWTRTNSYKAVAGNSFDVGKNAAPVYNSGTLSCSTVDCHNGIATPAWDSGSTGDCMACHTRLPM